MLCDKNYPKETWETWHRELLVLADVLAGRKKLLDEYGGARDIVGSAVMRCLAEGWSVAGCEFHVGDIQQGEAPMIELELTPPHEAVFWPRENQQKKK